MESSLYNQLLCKCIFATVKLFVHYCCGKGEKRTRKKGIQFNMYLFKKISYNKL